MNHTEKDGCAIWGAVFIVFLCFAYAIGILDARLISIEHRPIAKAPVAKPERLTVKVFDSDGKPLAKSASGSNWVHMDVHGLLIVVERGE
jgi:hypothetical protein